LIIVVTLLVSMFVIQTYDINDVSMEPTFDRQRNRVLVLLTPYYLGAVPSHGEIVIIDSRTDRSRTLWDKLIESPLVSIVIREKNDYMWVKRVIGLPGDSLEYREGSVVRNGEILNEEYILESMNSPFDPVQVPEGHLFVMGDNRNRSSDSRTIGPVPVSNIQGRVLLRFYPLDKISIY
jgi:signal peptidase I